MISIFRANIYYFETDFCEDFCSLLVAIGQKGTFYAIIIAAILSHPPVFFFRIFNKLRILVFRCSVFRNYAVPVFRCSGVPGFTNSQFLGAVRQTLPHKRAFNFLGRINLVEFTNLAYFFASLCFDFVVLFCLTLSVVY